MNKSNSPQVKTIKTPKGYENNPFYVATRGIELLFEKANSVGIFLAILAVVGALTRIPSFSSPAPATTSQPAGSDAAASAISDVISSIPVAAWVGLGIFASVLLIIIIGVGVVFRGVSDVTAARLARGKTISLSDAFREVVSGFWGYFWLQIIVGVKTILWSLLFIIPGIVMSFRYSLAGVSYFDKQLRANESVKDSLALTKGSFVTTFASFVLFDLITFGFIKPLVQTGAGSVLYRQLRPLTDKQSPRPKPHILSWVVIGGLVLLTMFIVFIVGLAIALAVSNQS